MARDGFTVTIAPDGVQLQVAEGACLLDELRAAGIAVPADCGGNGRCGKCAVLVSRADDPASEPERALACTYRVEGDIAVEPCSEAVGDRLVKTGIGRSVAFDPLARVVEVERVKAGVGEYEDEAGRLRAQVARSIGADDVAIGLEAIRALSELVAAETKRIWALVVQGDIVWVSGSPLHPYLVAFDIGTTSVVGYLLDGETGAQLAVSARLNPQSPYGADVVTRATYAVKEDGRVLTQLIREGLDDMVGELARDAGVDRGDIVLVGCAGNTCMHHLALGVVPAALLQVPYNATVSASVTLPASGLGLSIQPAGRAVMLPLLAGFVGADTAACLADIDLANATERTLMIDIGTNGELVMGTGSRALATSTAAGPALEGARISCGMRGAEGAIDHVRAEGDELVLSVIGGGAPKGICGSGVVDITALLVREGIVDKRGRFKRPDRLEGSFATANADRLVNVEGSGWQFTLAEGVAFTQRDVREVQLAKSAIAAGIQILSRKLGWGIDDIERVLIAGAFGTFMDPASACGIGLLPAQLLDRVEAIGNAAGEGTKIVLSNRAEFATCCRMARQIPFIELATEDDFQDLYVQNLNF